jgi:hypothetical protein
MLVLPVLLIFGCRLLKLAFALLKQPYLLLILFGLPFEDLADPLIHNLVSASSKFIPLPTKYRW